MKLKPSSKICIDKKIISKDKPVYFIAEIGSNFDNDLNRAKELIYMAKESGADAAKFQHYTARSLVSDIGFSKINKKKSHQSAWKKSVYETYNDASLNKDWTFYLQEACKDAGLSFFTSPYSLDLVDYVDDYVPAYKVGSGDITWLEIISHMASKGKPIFLATGASNFVDVKRAADTVLEKTSDIILLQCNTNYTADKRNYAHQQLRVITKYQDEYPGIITGLSDHMPGNVSVLGAVALGAKVIEKHFTDSTKRDGPDHSFSMTPNTWREMVDRTRELEESLGSGNKKIETNEEETIVVQRRSVYFTTNLKKGEIIKKQHLDALRPCPKDGIPPYEIKNILGMVLKNNISVGEIVKWNDFE